MRVVQRSGWRARTALPCRRVGDPRLTHCDEAGNVLQRREYGGPAGEEVLRLGRRRTKETTETGDVHQPPDSRISLAAR